MSQPTKVAQRALSDYQRLCEEDGTLEELVRLYGVEKAQRALGIAAEQIFPRIIGVPRDHYANTVLFHVIETASALVRLELMIKHATTVVALDGSPGSESPDPAVEKEVP